MTCNNLEQYLYFIHSIVAHCTYAVSPYIRYVVMQRCWSKDPEKRPPFSEIMKILSCALEDMAGYLHIGAFGAREEGENPGN